MIFTGTLIRSLKKSTPFALVTLDGKHDLQCVNEVLLHTAATLVEQRVEIVGLLEESTIVVASIKAKE